MPEQDSRVRSQFARVASWSLAAGVHVAPDRRGWVRAQQIAAFKQLLPGVAAANSANAILLLFIFWPTPQRSFLLVWAIAISLAASWPLVRALGGRRSAPAVRSQRAIWKVARDSGLLALGWVVMLVAIFPHAGVTQQAILAVVAVGMMCGGAFMLSTVPPAALAFSGLICLGSVAVLLIDGKPAFRILALLLASYFAVLASGIRWIASLFVQQLLSRAEASEKTELIGLLLHDFEQSSSDWLWHLDDAGYILEPSPRFVAAVGAAPGGLEGRKLIDLLRAGPERDAIESAIAGRRPFRDLHAPIDTSQGERWLSFAGQSRIGPQGRTGARGVASDVTAERVASAQIADLAHNDALTRLPNRRSLALKLEEALKADVHRDGGGLIFVDLDGFKSVNDTLGHHTGDSLLCAVAARLQGCVPPPATLGRMGGDEFAIVIPRPATPAAVERIGRDIVEAMRKPFRLGEQDIFSGCSAGIRTFRGDDSAPVTVMMHTDLALYAAKEGGRGRVEVFATSMEAALLERADIEAALRQALERDEFRLLLQPFVHARTGSLAGCEALIRWQHPKLGLRPPSDFIDIATQAGLIDQIGLWVIRTALEQMGRLPEPITVAVNVSATQLKSPHFCGEVMRALAHSGVDPTRLEMEITESALFDGSGHNLQVLERLSALGIRISLDDFGTGYSSLSHLRQFPFHKIKIDQSFVSGMPDREDCRSIVAAICNLASSLNMTTTAEGVETEEQLELVRAAGCGYVQGYLFSRPKALEAIIADWSLTPVPAALGSASLATAHG